MRNIIIAATVLLIMGCTQTPVRSASPTIRQSSTTPSRINENQTAPVKRVEKIPEEIAKSKEIDNRTPIERYHGDTGFALVMCKELFKLATLTSQKSDFDTFANCLSDEKTKSKESLKKALDTVKKTKAKEALKTYHVVVMSALGGIIAGLDERKIDYEQRQQALEGKVTEAWERFEIER